MCEICPELRINTTDGCQLGCSNVFVIKLWTYYTAANQDFCRAREVL